MELKGERRNGTRAEKQREKERVRRKEKKKRQRKREAGKELVTQCRQESAGAM